MKLVSKFALGILTIVIILLPAMVLFTPNVAKAANDTNIMTQCWTKEECDATASGDVGSEWDGKSTEAGVKCGKVATGKDDLGLCYSVNLKGIDLQVPIPTTSGKLLTNVKGFAQYLSEFYKFFMAALAVMAVVMIMWAGFKRILAAGRSEAIKDANEAFFSAIVGLVIALLSYSLLSLVNPKLVEITELRIPKIRTEQMKGTWCPYNLAIKTGNLLDLQELDILNITGDDKNSLIGCGEKFTYPNTKDACVGQYCGYGRSCVFYEEASGKPECVSAIANGKLSWNANAYIDHMWLGLVCKDGSYHRFYTSTTSSAEDVPEHYSVYTLGSRSREGSIHTGGIITQEYILQEASKSGYCKNANEVRGFVLEIEVNDDTSIGPTADDNYVVGKAGSNCTSIMPHKPLDKIDWKEVQDKDLLLLTDLPILWDGLQRRVCNASKMDCTAKISICTLPGDSCGPLEPVVTCDLHIDRNRFPAR